MGIANTLSNARESFYSFIRSLTEWPVLPVPIYTILPLLETHASLMQGNEIAEPPMDIGTLVKFCRKHALWFDLHYSEVENSFSLSIEGAGDNEFFQVRHGTLGNVIKWGIESAEEFYNGRVR